jgi:hypothetical protein
MNTIAAATPVAPPIPETTLSVNRIAGTAGLAFAAGVVGANAFLFGIPTAESAPADAAAWLAANRTRAAVGTSMVALTFPALLIFGAAMYQIGRQTANGRLWMMVGALGACAMTGVFSLVAASQISSILFAAEAGDAFTTAWTIHNAAFAVNTTILGTAFLGFAMGAHAAGVTSRGLRTAGLVGAGMLLATGFANTAVAAGSAVVFVGFGGFALWLLWLVATSLRLLKTSPPACVFA